jgi:hypothetical protein
MPAEFGSGVSFPGNGSAKPIEYAGAGLSDAAIAQIKGSRYRKTRYGKAGIMFHISCRSDQVLDQMKNLLQDIVVLK